MSKTVYNIPAGIPFAKALASRLYAETKDQPEALSDIRIFLPTRRACRVLREAFLQIADGKPLLLPRMQPFGDIDEEELSLSLTGQNNIALNLKPSITSLHRQLLLAHTIEALPQFGQGPDHALALAGALGRLMDQIHTENLNLADLDQLVPAEFAEHWQITVEFLKILSEHWPKILEEKGMIDIAERRNRLMLALNEYWQQNPPAYRVIAAGSTGSIPATAKFLSIIAALPKGSVILPGLDQDMDEESWQALEESHAQYGLRELLGHIGVARKDVKPWSGFPDNEISAARRILASEMMRPAETTKNWISLSGQKEKTRLFEESFENLSRFDCNHEREEAETIAVLMREILEQPGKTGALITPNRQLARRVAMACQRWGITIDDSAGQTLDQTSLGTFLRLIVKACNDRLAPVSLLALLKHRLCQFSDRLLVQALEVMALRGPKPAAGFSGIYSRLKAQEGTQDILNHLQELEKILTPFLKAGEGQQKFRYFLKAHIEIAEALSQNTLWQGEQGTEASALLSELYEQAELIRPLHVKNYVEILEQLLKTKTVRPAYGTHPRLAILGQLEARLIDADLVILGGLNEGTWPPDPGYDPWMSRPMRKEFGLPGFERDTGLAAHDFVQGFCSSHVVLTRSKRTEGTPSVPARWLQRLDTVLDAVGLTIPQDTPHIDWARALDQHETTEPLARPAPVPPVEKRPRKISATRIETWLKDPYAIYARYILNLRKLDPLEQRADAALRGSVLHGTLERFVTAYPADMPDDAATILRNYAREELAKHNQDPDEWQFWWPRFERITDWYFGHESLWRQKARVLATEMEGQAIINAPEGDFTITARADRIDRLEDGAAIIDYKSGGTYSLKAIKTGDLPQLPIEALIISMDGFENAGQHVASLGYWTMTGGRAAGKVTEIITGIDEIITNTKNGLTALIHEFDKGDTPYYSLPRPDRAPRFNDYEHLARVKEWAALNKTEEAA